MRIKGYKLKLAGDNTNVGVYFVNQITAERTKIDTTDIIDNNPSELVIVISDLTAGSYTFEVTSQYSGSSTPLKEARTSSFDKVLTVK